MLTFITPEVMTLAKELERVVIINTQTPVDSVMLWTIVREMLHERFIMQALIAEGLVRREGGTGKPN